MSDEPNNVLPLGDRIKKKRIDLLMDVLISDEVWLMLDAESQERFESDEEQRAFIIGAAWAIGYYGNEIEKGMKDE